MIWIILRVSIRVIIMISFTTVCMLLWLILKLFFASDTVCYSVESVVLSTALKLLGMRICIHGAYLKNQKALFVSNHMSWLDIMILAAILKIRVVFVSKKTVKYWPLLGVIAQLRQTIFIQRKKTKSLLEQQCSSVGNVLKKSSVLIFAEGTENMGTVLLPFKSSLFSVLRQHPHTPVQPITIVLSKINGYNTKLYQRFLFSRTAHKNMLWNILSNFQHQSVTFDIIFHPSMTFAEYGDRKMLGQALQKCIQKGMTQVLTNQL